MLFKIESSSLTTEICEVHRNMNKNKLEQGTSVLRNLLIDITVFCCIVTNRVCF